MLLPFKMTITRTAICCEVYRETTFDLFSLSANFNVWLASPEAGFLMGKFLWANWDVDELKSKAKEIEAGTQLSIGLVGWPFQSEKWSATWKS